jgi:hypothetical protein
VLEDDTPLNLFRMNLILTTSILFKPAPIKVATSLGLPAYEPRARAEVEQLQKQVGGGKVGGWGAGQAGSMWLVHRCTAGTWQASGACLLEV